MHFISKKRKYFHSSQKVPPLNKCWIFTVDYTLMTQFLMMFKGKLFEFNYSKANRRIFVMSGNFFNILEKFWAKNFEPDIKINIQFHFDTWNLLTKCILTHNFNSISKHSYLFCHFSVLKLIISIAFPKNSYIFYTISLSSFPRRDRELKGVMKRQNFVRRVNDIYEILSLSLFLKENFDVLKNTKYHFKVHPIEPVHDQLTDAFLCSLWFWLSLFTNPGLHFRQCKLGGFSCLIAEYQKNISCKFSDPK